MSIYLCIYRPTYVYLPFYPQIYLSTHLCIAVSLSLYIYIYISVPPMYLCIYVSNYLASFTNRTTLYLSISIQINQSICQSRYLSIYLSKYLSVCSFGRSVYIHVTCSMVVQVYVSVQTFTQIRAHISNTQCMCAFVIPLYKKHLRAHNYMCYV